MPNHPPFDDSPSFPRWFRRALVLSAALLMCSCRAVEPAAYGQGVSGPMMGDSCEACGPTGCPIEAPAPTGPFCPPCDACRPPQAGGGCPVCQPDCYAGPGDEYLCDGGDRPYPVGVLEDGDLIGLDQEDTVGHYTTRDGRLVVAPSCRVCIYAPRFASVRRVVHPMGAEQRLFVDAVGDLFAPVEAERQQPPATSLQNLAPRGRYRNLPPSLYRQRQQAGEVERLLAAAETQGLVPVYVNLQLMHLGIVQMDEAPVVAQHALAAITWTGDEELQVAISGQGASAVFSPKQPGLLYQTDEPNRPCLRIVKCASTDAAQPGDEVEFTLRFDNAGDAPINDLVIVDNLTTRLEYVEGSAKASRDADFSTARNDAGSLVLRWELDGVLKPGEGGVLTFRTRVR